MFEGLIIALIFLAGLSPLFWRLYVQHRWIPTSGMVVKNTIYPPESKSAAARYHYPSVEFAAQGETHVFESRWRKRATASPRFQVGDKVNVLYSPRKPKRAIIRTWGRYLRWAAIAEICMLIVFFIVPVLLALTIGNK